MGSELIIYAASTMISLGLTLHDHHKQAKAIEAQQKPAVVAAATDSKLHKGMKRAQVLSSIGAPAMEEDRNGTTEMIYTNKAVCSNELMGCYLILDQNGLVTQIAQVKPELKD